eukprot:Nk52_evm3s325 gene=Nk52_evmTU3s325
MEQEDYCPLAELADFDTLLHIFRFLDARDLYQLLFNVFQYSERLNPYLRELLRTDTASLLLVGRQIYQPELIKDSIKHNDVNGAKLILQFGLLINQRTTQAELLCPRLLDSAFHHAFLASNIAALKVLHEFCYRGTTNTQKPLEQKQGQQQGKEKEEEQDMVESLCSPFALLPNPASSSSNTRDNNKERPLTREKILIVTSSLDADLSTAWGSGGGVSSGAGGEGRAVQRRGMGREEGEGGGATEEDVRFVSKGLAFVDLLICGCVYRRKRQRRDCSKEMEGAQEMSLVTLAREEDFYFAPIYRIPSVYFAHCTVGREQRATHGKVMKEFRTLIKDHVIPRVCEGLKRSVILRHVAEDDNDNTTAVPVEETVVDETFDNDLANEQHLRLEEFVANYLILNPSYVDISEHLNSGRAMLLNLIVHTPDLGEMGMVEDSHPVVWIYEHCLVVLPEAAAVAARCGRVNLCLWVLRLLKRQRGRMVGSMEYQRDLGSAVTLVDEQAVWEAAMNGSSAKLVKTIHEENLVGWKFLDSGDNVRAQMNREDDSPPGLPGLGKESMKVLSWFGPYSTVREVEILEYIVDKHPLMEISTYAFLNAICCNFEDAALFLHNQITSLDGTAVCRLSLTRDTPCSIFYALPYFYDASGTPFVMKSPDYSGTSSCDSSQTLPMYSLKCIDLIVQYIILPSLLLLTEKRRANKKRRFWRRPFGVSSNQVEDDERWGNNEGDDVMVGLVDSEDYFENVFPRLCRIVWRSLLSHYIHGRVTNLDIMQMSLCVSDCDGQDICNSCGHGGKVMVPFLTAGIVVQQVMYEGLAVESRSMNKEKWETIELTQQLTGNDVGLVAHNFTELYNRQWTTIAQSEGKSWASEQCIKLDWSCVLSMERGIRTSDDVPDSTPFQVVSSAKIPNTLPWWIYQCTELAISNGNVSFFKCFMPALSGLFYNESESEIGEPVCQGTGDRHDGVTWQGVFSEMLQHRDTTRDLDGKHRIFQGWQRKFTNQWVQKSLECAVSVGNIHLVQWIYQYGRKQANLELAISRERHLELLMAAISNGQLSMVQFLMDDDYNIAQKDMCSCFNILIQIGLLKGHLHICDWLLCHRKRFMCPRQRELITPKTYKDKRFIATSSIQPAVLKLQELINTQHPDYPLQSLVSSGQSAIVDIADSEVMRGELDESDNDSVCGCTDTNSGNDITFALSRACLWGRLDAVKWLIANEKLLLLSSNEENVDLPVAVTGNKLDSRWKLGILCTKLGKAIRVLKERCVPMEDRSASEQLEGDDEESLEFGSATSSSEEDDAAGIEGIGQVAAAAATATSRADRHHQSRYVNFLVEKRALWELDSGGVHSGGVPEVVQCVEYLIAQYANRFPKSCNNPLCTIPGPSSVFPCACPIKSFAAHCDLWSSRLPEETGPNLDKFALLCRRLGTSLTLVRFFVASYTNHLHQSGFRRVDQSRFFGSSLRVQFSRAIARGQQKTAQVMMAISKECIITTNNNRAGSTGGDSSSLGLDALTNTQTSSRMTPSVGTHHQVMEAARISGFSAPFLLQIAERVAPLPGRGTLDSTIETDTDAQQSFANEDDNYVTETHFRGVQARLVRLLGAIALPSEEMHQEAVSVQRHVLLRTL